MTSETVGGVIVARVETFPCQTLDTIKLEVAGLQLVGKTFDDAQLLIFEEAPVACREHQHLRAGMTEYQELHVAMEPVTIPAEIFAFHGTLKNRLTLSLWTASCDALSG